MSECGCSTSGQTIKGAGCPTGGCLPCTDENGGKGPLGRPQCLVCSPSFNKNLRSNNTLVRLWCDPADPACKNNEATRLPQKVRVLADFAPPLALLAPPQYKRVQVLEYLSRYGIR